MGDNDAQTKATCPECGASIEASSTVCSECGFPLKSPKPEAPAVSKWCSALCGGSYLLYCWCKKNCQ